MYIRNILSNAAASQLSSDDVVRMYIDWINDYSEMHFQVIGAIYNSGGIIRGAIWKKIGKGPVREDSADADLYKLLFRDLSTGGVIRQHLGSTEMLIITATSYQKRGNAVPGVADQKPQCPRLMKRKGTSSLNWVSNLCIMQ